MSRSKSKPRATTQADPQDGNLGLTDVFRAWLDRSAWTLEEAALLCAGLAPEPEHVAAQLERAAGAEGEQARRLAAGARAAIAKGTLIAKDVTPHVSYADQMSSPYESLEWHDPPRYAYLMKENARLERLQAEQDKRPREYTVVPRDFILWARPHARAMPSKLLEVIAEPGEGSTSASKEAHVLSQQLRQVRRRSALLEAAVSVLGSHFDDCKYNGKPSGDKVGAQILLNWERLPCLADVTKPKPKALRELISPALGALRTTGERSVTSRAKKESGQ